MAKRSGSSIRVQQDLLRSLREAAESWWPRLTSELRWAAHYVHEDSCTRLYSGPGYPVQAAAWIMMARTVAASPDSLVARTPTPLEVEDGTPTSEMVVEIAGAMFAAPLTDRVVKTMTRNAVKTLETVLATGYDPWAGWLPKLRDENGDLELGRTLNVLHSAVGMLVGCMSDFEQHRHEADRQLSHDAGAADSWYTLVGVAEWLIRLMPLAIEVLPQAAQLPDQELPLDKRCRSRLKLLLESLNAMVCSLSVPARPNAPGLVAGYVWGARALPLAAWRDRETELRALCAAVAEYGPANPKPPGPQNAATDVALIAVTPEPPYPADWQDAGWFVATVKAASEGKCSFTTRDLLRKAKSGQFGTPGAWRPTKGEHMYDPNRVVAVGLPAYEADAISIAVNKGFVYKRKARGAAVSSKNRVKP